MYLADLFENSERNFIYTLGDPDSYDELLADSKIPHIKLGPRKRIEGEPYEGGIVFPTILAARTYIKQHGLKYNVYSLKGNWYKDTHKLPDEDHRRINKDLEILQKVFPMNENFKDKAGKIAAIAAFSTSLGGSTLNLPQIGWDFESPIYNKSQATFPTDLKEPGDNKILSTGNRIVKNFVDTPPNKKENKGSMGQLKKYQGGNI